MSTALFCGLTTIDVTQHVTEVPQANQKIVSHQTLLDVGGPAANAARTAAALGVPARLVTLLGDTPLARLALEKLFAEGIEVIDLAADSEFPVSTVFVDDAGMRTVVSRNNPNRKFRNPDVSILDDVAILEIDGHLPQLQKLFAERCKDAGIPVIFDGGSWKAGTDELLPLSTHVIISQDFVRTDSTAERTFDYLRGFDFQLLAQSAGEEPVHAVAGQQEVKIQVPHVAVKDTLGAGDVLHGSFTAFLPQASNPLTALREAIAFASKSTKYSGILGWLEADSEI
ncbi:PfkB family carbohydrate kinase [Arcanobacterium bovis]|uniref:Carbohydrate kinase PfkB domain-containing protein n=1 Tax=Arcanobacterium bovis TaxID=2529275 RepID=A0A4Q9V081_9ACTO|nr:PfkB family carbohydrate kinase [Arcanobacterium bovis]TBW21986.1 hypothetical protein EZJ44_03870 [Arcanobacterium bovis]